MFCISCLGCRISPRIFMNRRISTELRPSKFTKITFPMLKPMTIYVLTISIYGGMSMFTESYMLWSGNRSPQDIGLTIVGFLYRSGWEQNTMGLGSAVGIVLLIFTLIVNMIQLNFFGIFKRRKISVWQRKDSRERQFPCSSYLLSLRPLRFSLLLHYACFF